MSKTITVTNPNLWKIAQEELGDSEQWLRIAQLNGVDAPVLAGTYKLAIPKPQAGELVDVIDEIAPSPLALPGVVVTPSTVAATVPSASVSGVTAAAIYAALGFVPAREGAVANGVSTPVTLTAATIEADLGYVPLNAALGNQPGGYLKLDSSGDGQIVALAVSGSLTVAGRTVATLADLAALPTASGLTSLTLTGDVTGSVSNATSMTTTLAATGVTPGSYSGAVTVDAKGRVTAGRQLSAGDVTGALGFTPGQAFVLTANAISTVLGYAPAPAFTLTAAGIVSALTYTPAAPLGFTPVNRAGDTFTGPLNVLTGTSAANATVLTLGPSDTGNGAPNLVVSRFVGTPEGDGFDTIGLDLGALDLNGYYGGGFQLSVSNAANNSTLLFSADLILSANGVVFRGPAYGASPPSNDASNQLATTSWVTSKIATVQSGVSAALTANGSTTPGHLAVWDPTAQTLRDGGPVPTATGALSGITTLNGLAVPGANGVDPDASPYNNVVITQPNGVNELGACLDLHATSSPVGSGKGGPDFDARIWVSSGGVLNLTPGRNNYSSPFTFDASGNAVFQGTLTVSKSNQTGGGIVLSDDGDIVDLNDGWATHRFTAGIKVASGNKGGSDVIKLASNGNISLNGQLTAGGVVISNARASDGIASILLGRPTDGVSVLQFTDQTTSHDLGRLQVNGDGTFHFFSAGKEVFGANAARGFYANPNDPNVCMRTDVANGLLYFQIGTDYFAPLTLGRGGAYLNGTGNDIPLVVNRAEAGHYSYFQFQDAGSYRWNVGRRDNGDFFFDAGNDSGVFNGTALNISNDNLATTFYGQMFLEGAGANGGTALIIDSPAYGIMQFKRSGSLRFNFGQREDGNGGNGDFYLDSYNNDGSFAHGIFNVSRTSGVMNVETGLQLYGQNVLSTQGDGFTQLGYGTGSQNCGVYTPQGDLFLRSSTGTTHVQNNGGGLGILDAGYQPPGSNASIRSVATKFSEIISLADYGYVGGNVVADTDALGYAIAQFYARGVPGGSIYIPPTNQSGIWDGGTISAVMQSYAGSLSGDNSVLSIFGSQGATRINVANFGSNQSWITFDPTNVHLSNILFANPNGYVSWGKTAITMYGANEGGDQNPDGNTGDSVGRTRWNNLDFRNMKGEAIRIDGGHFYEITNTRTINVGRPFHIVRGGVDCRIEGGLFYNCADGVVVEGVIGANGRSIHAEGLILKYLEAYVLDPSGQFGQSSGSAITINEGLFVVLDHCQAQNMGPNACGLVFNPPSGHQIVLVEDIGSYWQAGQNAACIRSNGIMTDFRKIGGWLGNAGNSNVKALDWNSPYAVDIDCRAEPINTAWAYGTNNAARGRIRIVPYNVDSGPPISSQSIGVSYT